MEHFFGKIEKGKMILNESGLIADKNWNNIPKYHPNVMIDQYVIMPNHLHGIIMIGNFARANDLVRAIHELPVQNKIRTQCDDAKKRRKMLIPLIIGKFKMNSAKQINIHKNNSGRFWHRNYYDHIIRNESELNRIREYIINNPEDWEEDEYYRAA
jgi:REP element-mobilizing transposase RayT